MVPPTSTDVTMSESSRSCQSSTTTTTTNTGSTSHRSNGALGGPATPSTLSFSEIRVSQLDEFGTPTPKYDFAVIMVAEYDPEGMLIKLYNPASLSQGRVEQEFLVKQSVESARVGRQGIIFHLDVETILLRFQSEEPARKFTQMVNSIRSGTQVSVFKERTEDSSAMQYFQFYGYLSQQQNMMQDYIRTSTYQRAILSNLADFRDKIVLDVGAGSGILSFFAHQAGAKKVYAVEGSSIAKHAEALVKSNRVDQCIQVISGKIEEIELPEKVDMIISEPMGYMLLNERMLETYLHAKKWLKPSGKMFPSLGDLHVAPFQDEALYMEQINKVNFWYQEFFHGVNLSSLRDAALKEYFRQPIVDTFDIRICMAKTQKHTIDFQKAHETELHRIEIPLEFHLLESGTVHGLAFWFDVAFIGTGSTVWLSTSPTEPLTHWYQVRCLLDTPIFVKQGQIMTGKVLMVANMKQSYDVTIECQVMGTNIRSTNSLDLKNPYFRYTGVQPAPPPGENHTSPSENYWAQVDMQGARQAMNLVNGMIVDGLGHVSLDNNTANVPTNLSASANIHQGSIPATGRKQQPTTPNSVQNASSNGTTPIPPTSAANSLQFNQLIGGGVSPSLISQGSANMMIGDYMQGQPGSSNLMNAMSGSHGAMPQPAHASTSASTANLRH